MFDYIISNTAPRYTMLFNIMGPGEGNSYANKGFKYKHKRSSYVVIIDEAHTTHEKNTKSVDRESNMIPNTFKNLLDTSVLESDVVTRDASSGKVETVKFEAEQNCGFLWNTNTLGTNQMQDVIKKRRMSEIASVCLYRQNLVQSAAMIADFDMMQYGARFDIVRDACMTALYASYITCRGVMSRRVLLCINQLVFAEAMKLGCGFVFDTWIPPWTEAPAVNANPDLTSYMPQLSENRL
ncbi:hypothetical protein CRENBAI_008722 [Crenichthys baileyi]|uniref:Uncharacterized protein n=1 Tax=Crenichthys baileyi TaxID=28760 RepID=A0AAV9RMK3_9TELE